MGVDEAEALLRRIFTECQQTQAVHRRCVKDLVKCRRQCRSEFLELFKRCVFPIFESMKKEAAVERLVKLIICLVTYRDDDCDECDGFMEDVSGFLLAGIDAAEKSVRYRCSQLLTEIILTLPEDAEVSSKLWEEMTAAMQRRMQDKVAGIRLFSARALSRLSLAENLGMENDLTIVLYRKSLSSDPSPDVRKAVLMSMPVSTLTICDIVERTADVSGAVRKAAFSVIGNKAPISTLSIRQRNVVLQRGLLDRESAVNMECRSMLKDGWLSRDCGSDVLVLLKYLDVETNENVGDLVMRELLKEGVVEIDKSRNLQSYLTPEATETVRLMEAEDALYWKALCVHLHSEAHAKSVEAAKTRGAHADVLEAEAAEITQLLDAFLPSTVADAVTLVDAHHSAGASHSFASRQLLMLANVLDFSDSASRKSAAALINKFLCQWTTVSQHDSDSMDVTGDGIYIGGQRKWSDAVVELARKVHASPGAFVEALAQAVIDSGKACREGGASVLEWLQCLAVTGTLLENLKSLRQFPVHLIETEEMVEGLLLPAVNHLDPDVQRAAVRCLSLFCQLEEHPRQSILYRLEERLHSGSAAARMMAAKGFFDLVMCHGAAVLDEKRKKFTESPAFGIPAAILQVLANLLVTENEMDAQEDDEETVKSVAAEGFAKLLLRSRSYPELDLLQTKLFAALLRMYFDEDTKNIARLRQCLSVFFHNYASVAAEHKRCISKAFIPLMREEWPGVTRCPSNMHVATARKKTATQLSRFMLELLKLPLYSQLRSKEAENGSVVDDEAPDEGHEVLALGIASEITRLSAKKSAAIKSYKSALCKVLVSLKFRPSKQQEIKTMRKLLDLVVDAMLGEKLLLKELKAMALELKKLDQNSHDVIEMVQLESLLVSCGIDTASDKIPCEELPPKTPAVNRTKHKARPTKTAVHISESDDDFQTPPKTKTATTVARSQRTCKTVAIERMETILKKTKPVDFESEEEQDNNDEDSSDGSETSETKT